MTKLASTDRSLQQVEDDIAVTTEQDYQALTAKEESDLESLMSQCENAISNTEAFAEQLSSELSVLDGVRHGLNLALYQECERKGDFCEACKYEIKLVGGGYIFRISYFETPAPLVLASRS